MKKRIIIFILVSLMTLSSFIILKCGSNGGEEIAKWGSAIWGQSKWNQ